MKAPPNRHFWNKTDTFRVARMISVGLVVGITMRWLIVTTPPLPVQASSGGIAPRIEAPRPLKTEGASRSARD